MLLNNTSFCIDITIVYADLITVQLYKGIVLPKEN